jgi:probable F420-dependent oxidoreductase
MGGGAVLAPEVAVVVDPDAETARSKAREYAATYLAACNYVRNLGRLGFGDRDLADGGSDRLIDAVIPHGSPEAIAEAVQAHFDAGADHVCLLPVGHAYPPVDDYRSLARPLSRPSPSRRGRRTNRLHRRRRRGRRRTTRSR